MDQVKILMEFKEYYELQEKLEEHQVKAIIEDAKNNDYSIFDPLRTLGVKTNIIHAKGGLILIYGDDFYGYDHICKRHFGSTMKPYFGKRENPSIFPSEIGPINLLSYAKKIFKPEFLKKSDNVDIYEGEIELNHDEGSFLLRLVTYKNTGVIISMYPCDISNKNKLKVFRFGYGVTISTDTPNVIYHVKFLDPKTEEHFILKQIVHRGIKLIKAFIEYKDQEFDINIDNLPKEEVFSFEPVHMIGALNLRTNSEVEKRAVQKFNKIKSRS